MEKVRGSLYTPLPAGTVRPGRPLNKSCVLEPATRSAPDCTCPIQEAENVTGDVLATFSILTRTAPPEMVGRTIIRTLLPFMEPAMLSDCGAVHAEYHCGPAGG